MIPLIDFADVCYFDLNVYLLNKLHRFNNCIQFKFKYDHVNVFVLKWLSIYPPPQLASADLSFFIP